MILAGLYPWLKALHVVAALTFVGGVLSVTIVLDAFRSAPSGVAIGALRRWDQTVTVPAMLLVWSFGLALGLTGHWFGDPWLQAKLVLVLVLSGVHGVQSGRLRRASGEATVPRMSFAAVILGAAAAIAVLAVMKPWR